MLLCAAGDIHGAIDAMYDDVLAFEAALGIRFRVEEARSLMARTSPLTDPAVPN